MSKGERPPVIGMSLKAQFNVYHPDHQQAKKLGEISSGLNLPNSKTLLYMSLKARFNVYHPLQDSFGWKRHKIRIIDVRYFHFSGI
jgi:hypothetical protein